MSADIVVIIQARMGSSRFPGKSMAEINGRPILSYMMEQLSHCRMPDAVVLAIPEGAGDDALAAYAVEQGWALFRGDENDVLGRYYAAALAHGAGTGTGIVRLTGDDILPDPHLVDAVANLFLAFRGRYDFISTDRANRLPYGAGVDLLSFEVLRTAHEEATAPRDREHVVPFVKWNPERFPCLELTTSVDLSGSLSLSIDTPEDLARNEALITGLSEQGPPPYHLHDILRMAESLGT